MIDRALKAIDFDLNQIDKYGVPCRACVVLGTVVLVQGGAFGDPNLTTLTLRSTDPDSRGNEYLVVRCSYKQVRTLLFSEVTRVPSVEPEISGD